MRMPTLTRLRDRETGPVGLDANYGRITTG